MASASPAGAISFCCRDCPSPLALRWRMPRGQFPKSFRREDESKMAFDSELRDCFGESGLIFAGHPLGEVSAFKWLISLRERGIGLTAAKTQVDEYLRSRGADQNHIQNQLQRVTEHLKA